MKDVLLWFTQPLRMWKIHHLTEEEKRLLRRAMEAGNWGRVDSTPDEIAVLRDLEKWGIIRIWPEA